MITNNSTTILSLLKKETQTNHDTTETVALSHKIKAGTLNLAEYQKLLICNWNIHNSLKTAFADCLATISPSALHSFVDTDKVEWLQADLQALAIPTNTIAYQVEQVPNYQSTAALIGGLYVVEGSMLGGQYICRQLHNNSHIGEISNFHFYNGYGKETGKRWVSFQRLVKQESFSPDEVQTCITAARATFDFFELSYRMGMK